MDYITLGSFVFFTALVGFISWLIVRGDDLSNSTGYFLAGRSLSWIVIAGSLFMTNISAEQLTGLNGNAFAAGACVMAWETVGAATMIVMALMFLPRYLKSGITTVPEFLELRFGRPMRTLASCVFIYALAVAFLPFVLYAGAITMAQLFDVSGLLGVSDQTALWIMVIALAVIGGAYAVCGGLKAVAVSDTINGVLLLLGGFLIPLLGLYKLGGGSVAEGWQILLQNSPERLQAAGTGSSAEIPWHTLFTGMFIINIFYWCTNQAIVQRAFGAKNLEEGQKGVLFAALLKVAGVAMLVFPGIIAWHLHRLGMIAVPLKEMAGGGPVLAKDLAYPLMVRYVLPPWLTGFFSAAMFGAILSSFNSGLNSMSTLLSLDIYKRIFRPSASDEQVVKFGMWLGISLIVVCAGIAPFIGRAEGFFTLMRMAIAVVNVPILSVILMGMFSRRTPALGGYIAVPAGIIFFCYFNFIRHNDFLFFKVHWLHTAGLNMLFMLGIMAVVRWLRPLPVPYVQADSGQVDLTGWRYAKAAGWGLILLLLVLYAVLSPLGITGGTSTGGYNLARILVFAVVLFFAGYALFRRKTSPRIF
jgi:SSS family solute:Na+ symporter